MSDSISKQQAQDRHPPVFPQPHAIEWGEDDYGLFQVFEFGAVEHTFRWIPPGRFSMGTPETEDNRDNDEIQHWVTLSQGFWLGETTVTNALWNEFSDTRKTKADEAELPVLNVRWNDCRDWIDKLKQGFQGLGVRLPTEAEWEYACRAGKQTPYSWGSGISPQHANYDESNTKGVANVKRFDPNPWGLYQMHGNVWEWCHDSYGAYPEGEVSDPEGPDEGAERVLRGGSWLDFGRYLRAGVRFWDRPDYRYGDFGFRLALGRELKGGGAAGNRQAAAEQR